ncbi:DUF6980 family protein [Pseudonocardia spinosispora]|uniref:DUF6980 family protein n=1 Tax=Pseudonocardia spinosispora TaxID=103441 RepID=UPI001B7FAEA4|nr:hypothetical protein [Pseudonocardia spinosispora]
MSGHCCDLMTYYADYQCHRGHGRFDCPDNLLDHRGASNVYGLIIHDGGGSSVAIGYCPWCGTELAESRRFLAETLSEESSGMPARTIEV